MNVYDDYYYDKNAQYQLTAAQLADGWTVEFAKNSVTYRHNDLRENPTTDTPAYRLWHENGRLKREFHYQNNLRHNPNSSTPACRYWHQNGQIDRESNYSKGLPHDPAPNVPASKIWRANGQLSKKWHYQNGLFQNPNSNTPAVENYQDDGKVTLRQYYQNGLLHNPNSSTPAWQLYTYKELKINDNKSDMFDYCNGVHVPAGFWQWTISDALNTDNMEQRRVWFEINGGWEALESEFELLDEQPDPANSGFMLRLCKFPNKLDVYDNEARIIFCNNASLDLDGSRRRYALVVPVDWGNDALSVMARSFGLTSEEYSELRVAK